MHVRCGANGSEHAPRIAFPLHFKRPPSSPQTFDHTLGARSCLKDHCTVRGPLRGPMRITARLHAHSCRRSRSHSESFPTSTCSCSGSSAPGYARGRIVASAVLVVAEGGVAALQAPQLRTPRAHYWAEPMPPPSWGSAIAHLRRAGVRCALRLNVAVQAVRHPHNRGGRVLLHSAVNGVVLGRGGAVGSSHG